MEKKLQLLDSFGATGSDGSHYKVRVYEHLVAPAVLGDGQDHWESTGLNEYRLDSGERVEVAGDGSMRIAGADVRLTRDAAEATSIGASARRASHAPKATKARAPAHAGRSAASRR